MSPFSHFASPALHRRDRRHGPAHLLLRARGSGCSPSRRDGRRRNRHVRRSGPAPAALRPHRFHPDRRGDASCRPCGPHNIIIGSPGYHGSMSGLIENALDYTEDWRADRHDAVRHAFGGPCPARLEHASRRRDQLAQKVFEAGVCVDEAVARSPDRRSPSGRQVRTCGATPPPCRRASFRTSALLLETA